jgi:hypothetical protein
MREVLALEQDARAERARQARSLGQRRGTPGPRPEHPFAFGEERGIGERGGGFDRTALQGGDERLRDRRRRRIYSRTDLVPRGPRRASRERGFRGGRLQDPFPDKSQREPAAETASDVVRGAQALSATTGIVAGARRNQSPRRRGSTASRSQVPRVDPEQTRAPRGFQMTHRAIDLPLVERLDDREQRQSAAAASISERL